MQGGCCGCCTHAAAQPPLSFGAYCCGVGRAPAPDGTRRCLSHSIAEQQPDVQAQMHGHLCITDASKRSRIRERAHRPIADEGAGCRADGSCQGGACHCSQGIRQQSGCKQAGGPSNSQGGPTGAASHAQPARPSVAPAAQPWASKSVCTQLLPPGSRCLPPFVAPGGVQQHRQLMQRYASPHVAMSRHTCCGVPCTVANA